MSVQADVRILYKNVLWKS